MKKSFLITGLLLLCITFNNLQSQNIVRLWAEDPPTNNGLSGPEKVENNGTWISNISMPEMFIYEADQAINTGMAVIICPGGGYAGLATQHEGHDLAKWLNTKGITGIVLKYRMPNKHKEVPLDDLQEAMRYVRSHSTELNVDPQLIGVAGSSAGGHLAATASTHFSISGVSTRPDFTILFYPVITMTILTKGGTRINLLGDNPSPEDIYTFSCEKQVNVNTPPAIIFLSDDDASVPPINGTLYYNALKNNGIPASLHIYPEGGHGWGMGENFKYYSQTLSLLEAWLNDILKK